MIGNFVNQVKDIFVSQPIGFFSNLLQSSQIHNDCPKKLDKLRQKLCMTMEILFVNSPPFKKFNINLSKSQYSGSNKSNCFFQCCVFS